MFFVFCLGYRFEVSRWAGDYRIALCIRRVGGNTVKQKQETGNRNGKKKKETETEAGKINRNQ